MCNSEVECADTEMCVWMNRWAIRYCKCSPYMHFRACLRSQDLRIGVPPSSLSSTYRGLDHAEAKWALWSILEWAARGVLYRWLEFEWWACSPVCNGAPFTVLLTSSSGFSCGTLCMPFDTQTEPIAWRDAPSVSSEPQRSQYREHLLEDAVLHGAVWFIIFSPLHPLPRWLEEARRT